MTGMIPGFIIYKISEYKILSRELFFLEKISVVV